jgi:hypothetical protein
MEVALLEQTTFLELVKYFPELATGSSITIFTQSTPIKKIQINPALILFFL